MLAVVLIAGAALGVVLLAIRIVAGWVYAPAGVALGRFFSAAASLVFKLSIVALAGLILAIVIGAWLHA